MIVEVFHRMKYKVDRDVYDKLEGDEFNKAIKDGRIVIIENEVVEYEDGQLVFEESMDAEDFQDYVDNEMGD